MNKKTYDGFSPAFKFLYIISFVVIGFIELKSGGFEVFTDYLIAIVLDIVLSFVATYLLVCIYAIAISLNDK